MSICTYSHEHNNITFSSNIQDTTTCFGPICRPSLGCPKNLLSGYTVCVVIWKGSNCILYTAMNCNIVVFMTVCIYRYIHATALYY